LPPSLHAEVSLNSPNYSINIPISGKKISTNSPASPGINYKTGDIMALEKSFAKFLVTIYQKI
jgi:hypothetical protein